MLLFSITLQLCNNVAVIIDYVANREYIAKNLCENKSKPNMHCNGKCHLMKQLQKQNKKQSNPLSTDKQKNEVQFFQEKETFHFFNSLSSAFLSIDYSSPLTSSFAEEIFHPPIL